jgi:hypothetical protein
MVKNNDLIIDDLEFLLYVNLMDINYHNNFKYYFNNLSPLILFGEYFNLNSVGIIPIIPTHNFIDII